MIATRLGYRRAMLTRVLAVGVAAGCLAVVTGCSSSGSSGTPSTTPSSSRTPTPLSSAAYSQALHRIATEETQAQTQVGAALHASSVGDLRNGLITFAVDQAHVSTQLRGLTPPANAAAANAALASAFDANASATEAVVARLANVKSVKRAQQIIQNDKAAQRVGARIDAALKKLQKLGYTAGS